MVDLSRPKNRKFYSLPYARFTIHAARKHLPPISSLLAAARSHPRLGLFDKGNNIFVAIGSEPILTLDSLFLGRGHLDLVVVIIFGLVIGLRKMSANRKAPK